MITIANYPLGSLWELPFDYLCPETVPLKVMASIQLSLLGMPSLSIRIQLIYFKSRYWHQSHQVHFQFDQYMCRHQKWAKKNGRSFILETIKTSSTPLYSIQIQKPGVPGKIFNLHWICHREKVYTGFCFAYISP